LSATIVTRRIEKKDLVDPNNTKRYYYNYRWQVLCEYDGGGSYQKMFIYGNYIDEVLYTQGTSPATRRYYVHDHLYSPVALVYAGTAAVIERYEYDAYGNCYVMDASYNPRTKSSYGNPFYFTGRDMDVIDNGNLKIYNYRHRYYDSYTGRFTNHDPLGYVDGMNLYEYAKSNPVLLSDPSGLACPCISWVDWLLRFMRDYSHWSLDFEYKCFSRWLHESTFGEVIKFDCQSNKDIVDKPCTFMDIGEEEWRYICGERTYQIDIMVKKKCKQHLRYLEKAKVTEELYKCSPVDGVWKWNLWDEEPLGERTIREWHEIEYRYIIHYDKYGRPELRA
jgi:RHS repeat-associated protein